jgi:phosphoglucosamine mutase
MTAAPVPDQTSQGKQTMRKLFGTDGIRGVAGEPPLDPATVFAIGLALANALQQKGEPPRVLLGQDTRESSDAIAATLTAGLIAGGASVENAGVMTTPGIAHLTHTHAFAAGIVISASHNPWQDNGIKLFGPDGFKLPDATELAIEQEIFAQLERSAVADRRALDLWAAAAPPVVNDADRAEYVRFLLAAFPGLSLRNLHVIVDCANGAASAVAPQLFAELSATGQGGTVTFTHASPDGRNINAGCGALHPEVAGAEVVRHRADLGITFDGDADRALFADATGKVVNGDAVLLLIARDLKQRGQLTHDTVVATTMSNMGLEAALARSGIQMLRAPVGDKYVLEQMLATGATLGGEQSGHVILRDLATTGDGLLTALAVLDLLARTGQSLAELTADLKTFPQVIVNVRVREKRPLDTIARVAAAITEAERALAGTGRVVIRYSGTEALARVMIEAEDEAQMRWHAEAIAAAIRAELGLQAPAAESTGH